MKPLAWSDMIRIFFFFYETTFNFHDIQYFMNMNLNVANNFIIQQNVFKYCIMSIN